MIQPNPYFLQYMGTFLMKLYIKKRKKSLKVDDGWRQRTTTTDELALEKLRCHSAGGANKNYAKFIILINSRQRSVIICLILWSFVSAHEHRFVKLIFIDCYTITERS